MLKIAKSEIEAQYTAMDFARPISSKIQTPRIQFYNEPPTHTLGLEHLEQLAIERLKILKCVETVGQDFIRGSKEYDERLSAELCKIGPIGKSFTLTSNQPKNITEDIHNDVTSHFILQVFFLIVNICTFIRLLTVAVKQCVVGLFNKSWIFSVIVST